VCNIIPVNHKFNKTGAERIPYSAERLLMNKAPLSTAIFTSIMDGRLSTICHKRYSATNRHLLWHCQENTCCATIAACRSSHRAKELAAAQAWTAAAHEHAAGLQEQLQAVKAGVAVAKAAFAKVMCSCIC
jgi:hypothetical protein